MWLGLHYDTGGDSEYTRSERLGERERRERERGGKEEEGEGGREGRREGEKRLRGCALLYYPKKTHCSVILA